MDLERSASLSTARVELAHRGLETTKYLHAGEHNTVKGRPGVIGNCTCSKSLRMPVLSAIKKTLSAVAGRA